MPEKKDHYHHGDLRRALMEAALQLATERGIEGFTLREVAREAGVSHAAPYHHFVDKAALIEALAIEGYHQLRERLQHIYDQTQGNALDKMQAIGIGYVQFAQEQTALFHFMNWPQLRQLPIVLAISSQEEQEHSELRQAANGAYQVLVTAIINCQQTHLIAVQSPEGLALTMWCTVHGLAMMIIDTPLSKQGAELASEVLSNLRLRTPESVDTIQ